MNFSPYQPPPDVPSADPPTASSKKKSKRPWFPRDPSSYGNSYQSGGSGTDPSPSNPSYLTNDPEAQAFQGSSSSGGGGGGTGGNEERANSYETRFGWRVDVMAGLSYVLGPVTALILLILETQNDYVRFHSLMTTPMILFYLFMRLIGLWQWLRSIITLGFIVSSLFMAFRAFKDADVGLARFYLPVIGELAESFGVVIAVWSYSQSG